MYIKDHNELAKLVNGQWISPPPAGWVPKRIIYRGVKASSNLPQGTIFIPKEVVKKNSQPVAIKGTGDNVFCVLVSKGTVVDNITAPVLQVPSIRSAVDKIADSTRSDFQGKVIAVTGSVGKTTTKNILLKLLGSNNKVYCGPGNANGSSQIKRQISTLTSEKYAIFEVARIALPSIAKTLNPSVAILTSISEAHMEVLKSLENTTELKSQLFSGLTDQGVAIICRDIPHFDIAYSVASKYAGKVITYGVSPDSDIQLVNYCSDSSLVTAVFFGRRLEYRLGIYGQHNAMNSLSALAAIYSLGLSIDPYLEMLDGLNPVEGRGAIHDVTLSGKKIKIINDAYNANPLSMKASLDSFKLYSHSSGRKILVLGSMLELGEQEYQLHNDLLNTVINTKSDKVYLVGDLMIGLWAGLPSGLHGAHLSSYKQLACLLYNDLTDGDLVLFKSSASIGLSKVCKEIIKLSGDKISLHISVRGQKLQATDYCLWLKKHAAEAGVNGWARNNSDGSVEAVVSGHSENISRLLIKYSKGPGNVKVHDMNISEEKRPVKEGFRVYSKGGAELLPFIKKLLGVFFRK